MKQMKLFDYPDGFTIEVTLGQLFLIHRKQLGLTQKKVAEKAGISVAIYGGIEKDQKPISKNKYKNAICFALTIDPVSYKPIEVLL